MTCPHLSWYFQNREENEGYRPGVGPVTVALVHDWLTGMRGGEKVLESLCRLFPDAPIHTLLHTPGTMSPEIERHPIVCSFLQRIPGIDRRYRAFLPLFPSAIEGFDLSGYDLVLSSSHCVAKGVRPHPEALHISYCHTPMRYAWDMREAYLKNPLSRLAAAPLLRYLRGWDRRSSDRTHRFIANAEHVRERIRRCYGREADVIHPPVETDRFHLADRTDGYFLIVSALVPYKRIDLAVDAFNRLGLPLRIVGDGPERRHLMRRARPNVTFLGRQPDDCLPDLYARAAAFILPGLEDFGIAPVEAQAAGRPVIALRAGGALETVVENRTGQFFWPQTVEALAEAVRRFDPSRFPPEDLRAHAQRFDRSVFERRMREIVNEACESHRKTLKRRI